ncbi:hypothetical protein BJV74DRAFT_883786 [Russula compacta]|nr:hypothetical protein BJV74DRAFT_883786 [Russula compacta]
MSIKLFVFGQFAVVITQSVMYASVLDSLNYSTDRIVTYTVIVNSKSATWQAVVNSSCQLVLIMMANAFLAARIYSLTRSRLQSGLVLGFSMAAFSVGLITLVTTWKGNNKRFSSPQLAASVIWHVLQAIAECLIMFFLARALLSSRSGLQRSDSVVNHLVRNVIQIGLFAMIWTFAELGTFFLLPKLDVYTVFDMTSGLIYTHKGVQMIYDGLLSRPRLRTRLAERSQLEVGLPSQSLSHPSTVHNFEGKRLSETARGRGTVSFDIKSECESERAREPVDDSSLLV